LSRFFAGREATLIDQAGKSLSASAEGVTLCLYWHDGAENPTCAEIISGEHHAEIGLWFDGRGLCDFDGAFFLPREIARVLAELGYTVPDGCLA